MYVFIYVYIYIWAYLCSWYSLSHLSRISRTSPRYPKVSLEFRSRRGHCLLVFNGTNIAVLRLCDLLNFETYQTKA